MKTINKKLTNNYEAVNEIALFRKRYIDPLRERVGNGRKVMNNPDHKWKDEKEKKAFKERFDQMQIRINDYDVLYDKVLKLAREHEGLVDLLAQLYVRWHTDVSFQGEQQKEMMSGQAEVLQSIFVMLFEVLDPLCLQLPKPKYDEKAH